MKRWHKITLSLIVISSVLLVVFWPPPVKIYADEDSIILQNLINEPINDLPANEVPEYLQNPTYSEPFLNEKGINNYEIDLSGNKIGINDFNMFDPPEVEYNRWGGESWFTKSLVVYPFIEPSYALRIDDKVIWENKSIRVEIYALDNKKVDSEFGGIEYNVILKEKPQSNVIIFEIDYSPDLRFYYQASLTEEEIADGNIRPDNVIGSYAVYSINNRGHVTGDINYATGKVGHIYRPEAYDSNGWSVLGELRIDEKSKIMTITLPQDFLDKAVYPIYHAGGDTFGYTSVGSSSGSKGANIIHTCYDGYTPSAGTCTSMSLAAESSSKNVQCAIYLVSDDTKLTNGSTDTFVTTGGGTFDTGTFSSNPTLAAVAYYLCWNTQAWCTIRYDSGASAGYLYDADTFGTWTSPASWSQMFGQYIWSVYGTYTPSAEPSISNTPSSKDFGTVADSSSYWSSGSEPSWPLTDGDAYFTVTNNGSVEVDIYIDCTDFDGGGGWNLVTGSPGSGEARLLAYKEGDGSTDNITVLNTQTLFISSLAASNDIDWELRIDVPTVSDKYQHSANITLEASAS